MAYRFIEAQKASHSINLLVRVLKVSKSAYYAWRTKNPSKREREDQELLVKIRHIHHASHGTYGAPRIHAELREEHNTHVGKKRVARLMRSAGLVGIHRRKNRNPNSVKATPAAARAFPNLVRRDFTADAPDRVWLADITQHPTKEGWLHLAVVMDVFSRRIIGWSMDERMQAELVVDALQMAILARRPPLGLIHHSDRGGQYLSLAFGRRLEENGMLGSMSRPGLPADNAALESFFASLQTELLDRRKWLSRRQLRSAIFHFVEVFYNRQRRHSALEFMCPLEFERRYDQRVVAI